MEAHLGAKEVQPGPVEGILEPHPGALETHPKTMEAHPGPVEVILGLWGSSLGRAGSP
jgi:hypothetical protein